MYIYIYIYIDWRDYPGPLFDNWEQAAHYMLTTPMEEVDLLQSAIRDWYHNTFKIRIVSTVEDSILSHYPKLATATDHSHSRSQSSDRDVAVAVAAEDAKTILSLKADIIRIKLDTANIFEYAVKLEHDIIILADGVNALMAANNIYNERIMQLEQNSQNSKDSKG